MTGVFSGVLCALFDLVGFFLEFLEFWEVFLFLGFFFAVFFFGLVFPIPKNSSILLTRDFFLALLGTFCLTCLRLLFRFLLL